MAYKNKHDKSGQCSEMGFSAEEKFRELAIQKDFLVVEASTLEQFSHLDFLLEKNGKIWKIDVKARKKIKRSDDEPSDEFCWVEFQNCIGRDGWLRGNADYIAFERKDNFLIISRQKLLELAENLVDFNSIVDKPHKAHRKIYRRFNRKDQISYIEFAEIEKLNHFIWQKENPK